MYENGSQHEGVAFLRALVELSAAVFRDDLTNGLAELADALERGDVSPRDVADRLDPIRGALMGRVRRAVESPSLEILRALWTVVHHDDTGRLGPELERFAVAWRDAASPRQRARAEARLRAWVQVRESLLSRALRGPFL